MPQPEITFRHGSCQASIFSNEYKQDGETRTVRTVSFQRRFRDRKGEWQASASLRAEDIPKAVLILQKAYEYLTVGQQDTEEMEELEQDRP